MAEDEHGKETPPTPRAENLLPRELCRVTGLNLNYASRAGTGYHIQIEDRGPVFDDAREEWVRRVNTIVYANYGEPTARIVLGRDRDFPDRRTRAHNQLIAREIETMAAEAKTFLERREERQATRIKALLRRYYQRRDDAAKREFDEINRSYPFVFSRAWKELKQERARVAAPEAAPTVSREPEIDETLYPLDPTQRALVLEIERVRDELERDLSELQARGAADDILVATCAKILYRVHESLTRRGEGTGFAARRLEMTKKSLVTTYRQVRAQLSRQRLEEA